MAFSIFNALPFGKRPVWLYRVSVGGTAYHYTSKGGGYTTPNNRPNTDYPTGQVWSHAAIVRGEIFQTAKANRNDTWLRLPTKNPLSAAMISNRDYGDAEVEIWQGYIGDPDNEFVLQFKGRVVEVEPALLLTTIICETSISATRRSSVAEVVQRPCRHAHYFTNSDGGGCRLNLADRQVSVEVTASEGRTLTIPDAANVTDGNYLAGLLEYNGEVYMIEAHSGSSITVENPIPGLADAIAAGATNVLIAEGCDLSPIRCNQFGNIANFGGFNDMEDSKFDGRSMV